MSSGDLPSKWVDVGPLSTFPEGQITAVEVQGRALIVIYTNGDYRCFDDACAHQPIKLSEFGLLAPQGILMCQAHGACFDVLKGGAPLCFPAREGLVSWSTQIAGANLQVLLR